MSCALHRTTNPLERRAKEPMNAVDLSAHASLIFIQTLREAPSGPHVSGMGKHVNGARLSRDTHWSDVLFVSTALEN